MQSRNYSNMFIIFGGIPLILFSICQTLDWLTGIHWSNFPLNAEIIYRISLPIGTGLVGCVAALALCLIQNKLSTNSGNRSSQWELRILACISIPIFCWLSFMGWGFSFDNGGLPVSLSDTRQVLLSNTLVTFPIAQFIAIAIGFVCALVLSALAQFAKLK